MTKLLKYLEQKEQEASDRKQVFCSKQAFIYYIQNNKLTQEDFKEYVEKNHLAPTDNIPINLLAYALSKQLFQNMPNVKTAIASVNQADALLKIYNEVFNHPTEVVNEVKSYLSFLQRELHLPNIPPNDKLRAVKDYVKNITSKLETAPYLSTVGFFQGYNSNNALPGATPDIILNYLPNVLFKLLGDKGEFLKYLNYLNQKGLAVAAISEEGKFKVGIKQEESTTLFNYANNLLKENILSPEISTAINQVMEQVTKQTQHRR